MNKIRIGIVGYGNIGRGVELAIERNDDMELVAIVTRRNPEDVNILTEGVKKVHLDDVLSLKGEVDVMILCGGSATDLPVMGPQIAKNFNIIDSFDTHAKIPEYFANVDAAAKEGIRGLTRVAANEWGKDGINVNIVCPLAWTAALENFQDAYPEAFKANVHMPPAGHYGDVEKEIGRVVVQLCGPDFKYMNGETVTLEGGMGQRP